jgi:hypothetical protein
MCYLVREQPAGAAERGGATLPPSIDGLRPRWIGAGAAALIGGLALAAFVAPPLAAPPGSARDAVAPAPVATLTVAVPTAGVAERGALPADDGVPTTTDVVKAGAGPCHHGL